MAFSRLLAGVLAGFLLLGVVSAQTNGNATCDAKLGGSGFDVCLFETTGNLATSGIAFLANNVWALQSALYLGSCYCNANCNPSQIVCGNPPLFKAFLAASALGSITGPNQTIPNVAAQIVYQYENYQLYCYCPQYETPAQACVPEPNPQKCYLA